MTCFGFEMHIDNEKNGEIKASKTKCVSSPPQFFSNLNLTLKDYSISEDGIIEELLPEERRIGAYTEIRHNSKTSPQR